MGRVFIGRDQSVEIICRRVEAKEKADEKITVQEGSEARPSRGGG